jgi:cohesin loading factor subunit SCC2
MAADSKDVLATLLKHLMYGLTDADKDRKTAERQERNKELHSQCSFLVDSMMEQLLLLEENRERLGNTFGKKLVALFRSLAVFGEIAPVEVLRHLDTVTPYLKADNSVSHEQESHIVSEISELITLVAPNMTSRDIMRMTDGAVIDDLVTITKRFGSGPLSNAMRALGSLAKHCLAEGDNAITKKQMKLVSSFYGYLLKNKLNNVDFSKPDVKLRNNTSRALSVLAAFCRYYEVDEEKEEWPEMADVNDVAAQDLTSANVMHACYSLFLWYLQRDDAAMKCAALRALSCVFIARPPVMLNLEQDGTIEDLMSPDSPVELQLESLLCWKEILISEANRVDSGEAKKKMKSKKGLTLSKQISGDLDGEATVLAGVVHQHSSRFYEMTTHKDQRIRLATVELLGVLLSQGQLNPMDAVKYLFAMQGDVQAPSVRALSLRLLIAEKEKRAEMIRQRGLAGVKQAYKLQRAVYSSTLEPTAVIKRKRGKTEEVVSVFDSAFKECIRDAKKHKMGLYRSLLGLFASDMFDEEQFCRTSKKMAAKQKKDLSLLSFTAQVLAHLPYNVASDPLFIIHHLSGMTAIQGAQLLDRLSSFLRPYQLTTADELDNNVSEDILEKAAKSKSPSRKKEISRINGADFDLEKFSNLLGEACAMVLLLRLKTFLRKVYKFSELRCLEYSPEAKEVQKHLHPPENMPVFNASLEMATTAKRGGKCHDVDALIRLYAEFRILMRAEQSSTASSDSEETSPPSSSKKRKNSE